MNANIMKAQILYYLKDDLAQRSLKSDKVIKIFTFSLNSFFFGLDLISSQLYYMNYNIMKMQFFIK